MSFFYCVVRLWIKKEAPALIDSNGGEVKVEVTYLYEEAGVHWVHVFRLMAPVTIISIIIGCR